MCHNCFEEMCTTTFNLDAKHPIDDLQRSSKQPKHSNDRDWLMKKKICSRTCQAKVRTEYCQSQRDGESPDTTHQDLVCHLDETRSQRSTTMSQSSCTKKLYHLRVGSDEAGSTWLSAHCHHDNKIEDIFAMATCNEMYAHETIENPYQIWQTFAKSKPPLSSLDYDVLSHCADELMEICVAIFINLEIDKDLGIDKVALNTFVRHVRNHMNDNPYHNWFHVVDVVQSLYSIGLQCGIWNTMSIKEKFSMLAAAMCHDLDHPGVNNAFIDKTRSSQSFQPDIRMSCLEEHHSLKATELMTNSERTGLLDSLAPEDKCDILERVEAIILATNMNRHGEYMSQLKVLTESRQQDDPACSVFDEPQRRLVAEALVKCADMGNILRPFPVAKDWARRVTEEFFRQGDLERSLGVEISPMCDRRRDSCVGLQQGFVRFVAPFYEAVAQLLPSLRPLIDRIVATRAGWEKCVSDDALLAEVPLSAL